MDAKKIWYHLQTPTEMEKHPGGLGPVLKWGGFPMAFYTERLEARQVQSKPHAEELNGDGGSEKIKDLEVWRLLSTTWPTKLTQMHP